MRRVEGAVLGWHISVYRQLGDGGRPAKADSERGTRIAVWQTGLGGLQWINELVKAGEAIALGGDGYPFRYTAKAEHLIPRIIPQPPGARTIWMRDEEDVVTSKWEGRTQMDGAAASDCPPDEWLLVVAWDES